MDTYKWICKAFGELTTEELYQILNLRNEVFVVEQDCVYLDTDQKDQLSWHFCGWNETGDLVAYTRLVPKGISYADYASIGRVLTSQKVRGKGLGRPLMIKSITAAKKLFGEGPIKISAQDHLRNYYGSVGFEAVGEIYEEDGIPHVAMVLK